MEKKNKFTPYALKKKKKEQFFSQKSPKKCETCSKFQTRRILLPKILPDRHQRQFVIIQKSEKRVK